MRKLLGILCLLVGVALTAYAVLMYFPMMGRAFEQGSVRATFLYMVTALLGGIAFLALAYMLLRRRRRQLWEYVKDGDEDRAALEQEMEEFRATQRREQALARRREKASSGEH